MLHLTICLASIDFDIQRKLHQRDAETAIQLAAADSKLRYDAKHNPIRYEVGKLVFFLRLHKGYNLPGRPHRKWTAQRTGPSTLMRKVSKLAYELNFPRHWQVHRVVSLAHLTPAPTTPDPFGRRQNRPGRIFEKGDNGSLPASVCLYNSTHPLAPACIIASCVLITYHHIYNAVVVYLYDDVVPVLADHLPDRFISLLFIQGLRVAKLLVYHCLQVRINRSVEVLSHHGPKAVSSMFVGSTVYLPNIIFSCLSVVIVYCLLDLVYAEGF